MIAPEELIGTWAKTNQRQPHQRCLCQIKPLPSVFGLILCEGTGLLIRSEMLPVELFPLDINLAANDLQWLIQVFPDEGSSQYGVSIDDPPPSALKCAYVQPRSLAKALSNIDIGTKCVQAVEEHALLQWRERIHLPYISVFSE